MELEPVRRARQTRSIMRVHCIQHSENVVPANVEAWCRARSHELVVVRADHAGLTLPPVTSLDLLVILGGPMNIHEEAEHPWLVPEKAWLRDVIEARVPTLGICLGSQLLAALLGGTVTTAAEREIGFTRMERLPAATDSPVFGTLPASFDTFSWHSDTWSLPPGALLAARSEACENQAFEWGGCIYGVQFHPEFSHASTTVLATAEDRVVEPGRWVQQPAEFLAEPARFEAMEPILAALLDAITQRHERTAGVPA